MRLIKNILMAAVLLAGGVTMTSCTDYQDEIDALDKRVTYLEELVNRVNLSIAGIEDLLGATEDGYFITGLVEVLPKDDPKGVGYYTISFGKIDPETGKISEKASDKKAITIYNGTNGKDASAPNIEVRQGDDGNYYWYIDGIPMVDPNTGKAVQANGKNGKDGKDGADGKDGKDGEDGKSTAPILDIDEDGIWIISYDSGAHWQQLKDADGTPISATGKPGEDAKSIIKGIYIKVDIYGNRYAEIDLGSGQTLLVPILG